MPKVYVPQVPSRYDVSLKAFVPTINIDSASEYGEIVTMLPPQAGRVPIGQITSALKERMADFSESDYLVGVGDPSIIAIAAVIAARASHGKFTILKWDRVMSRYIPVEVKV